MFLQRLHAIYISSTVLMALKRNPDHQVAVPLCWERIRNALHLVPWSVAVTLIGLRGSGQTLPGYFLLCGGHSPLTWELGLACVGHAIRGRL